MRLRGAIAALALAMALDQGVLAAEKTILTPAEMRQTAAMALRAGTPSQALRLAQALLARDAVDVDALLIHARAARDLGRNATATISARKAWQLADTDTRKYAAALVMSQVLASDDKRTRAQLWLRRAAHLAPTPRQRAATIRDFNYVRRRNPLSVRLSFSAAPSSNINNGSAHDSTQLLLGSVPIVLPITGAARALSGTEFAGGLSGSYRLGETRRSQTSLSFDFGHRTYTLSSTAKALAPGVSGGDFAFSNASLGLEHWVTPEGHGAPLRFALRAGRTWYGGAPYTNVASIEAFKLFRLDRGSIVSLGVNAARQLSQTGGFDARRHGLQLGLTHVFANGNRLQFTATATESRSRGPMLEFSELSLDSRLQLARPVADMRFELGLRLAKRLHDRSRYTVGALHKTTVGAHVTVLFPELDYMGFIPALTLSSEATRSNVNLFETDALGVGLGIRSSF